MGRVRMWSLILFLLAGMGCAKALSSAADSCAASERPMLRVELYFGRFLPGGGEASEEAWREFVRVSLTRYFPDGLTVLDAEGQWLSPTQGPIRETTKVAVVFLPLGQDWDKAVENVRADYKRLFHQESVLKTIGRTCVSF